MFLAPESQDRFQGYAEKIKKFEKSPQHWYLELKSVEKPRDWIIKCCRVNHVQIMVSKQFLDSI